MQKILLMQFEISCQKNRWITNNYLGKDLKSAPLSFLLSIVLPYNYFSSSGFMFILINSDEIVLALPIIFILFILRWIFYAEITSYHVSLFSSFILLQIITINLMQIGGNLNLTIFHEKVENFERFMKHELIDEDLVAHTIQNYQYVWKKTRGIVVHDILNDFHAHLHEDITMDLYADTFKITEFFCDADNSLYRLMSVHVHEMFFKKDAEILRCNDIQQMVYVVSKGKVDISIAKMKLCTLGAGGMFGSFKGTGRTRQTIDVVARYHCRILAIDGNEFYKVHIICFMFFSFSIVFKF